MKNFYLENYGCQMNKADSNSLINSLMQEGFIQTDDYKNADNIIINTCSVRAHAEERVFSRVKLFSAERKKNKKNTKLIIMGCMAQTSKDILENLGVDKIFDVYNEMNILDYMKDEEVFIKKFNDNYIFNKSYVDEDKPHKAFLPISHGCNNWCAYCIVPHTRGKMVSRKSGEIIEEVKRLIGCGAKEITLLGQNVNSYGLDIEDEISFTDLLYLIDKTIDKIVGENKVWIRFLTSHPKDFDKNLADAIWNIKSVGKHIHLPFQSGSNRILKLMNRKYDKEEYIKKISYLREYEKDFPISTDVIVGYADETEEEYKETLDLLKEIGFEDAYLYKYSEREGSIAFKKKVLYDEIIGAKRLRELVDFQRVLAYNLLKKQIGKKTEIMIDDIAKDNIHYQCRSKENRLILIKKDEVKDKKINMGDIYFCEITEIKNHTLIGKIV